MALQGVENLTGVTEDQARTKASELGINIGNKINPTEMTALGQAFNITPKAVYGSNNISNAQSNPAPRPDDLLGIRKQVYAEQGIPDLNAQYQNAYTDYLKYQDTLDAQQNALEGQTVGLNVIRGEQAQAQRLGAQTLSAKARGLEALGSRLTAAKQEASDIFGIRSEEVQFKRNLILQYPGAKIKFGDSVDSAASKIAKYTSKEKIKDLYMTTFGSTGKGMSSSTMEKKLKSKAKKDSALKDQLAQLELESKKLAMQKVRESMNGGIGTTSIGDLFGDSGNTGTTGADLNVTDSADFNFYGL